MVEIDVHSRMHGVHGHSVPWSWVLLGLMRGLPYALYSVQFRYALNMNCWSSRPGGEAAVGQRVGALQALRFDGWRDLIASAGPARARMKPPRFPDGSEGVQREASGQ